MAEFGVIVKTLKNQKATVQVKPDMTIGELKFIICRIFAEIPANRQRLIFASKILSDKETIKSCKIQSQSTIIVMFSHKIASSVAATAVDSATTSAIVGAASTSTTVGAAATSAIVGAAATSTTVGAAATSAIVGAAATSITVGAAATAATAATVLSDLKSVGFPYDQNTAAIMEMNPDFTSEQIAMAMRAASNDLDRAVEYLYNPNLLQTKIAEANTAEMLAVLEYVVTTDQAKFLSKVSPLISLSFLSLSLSLSLSLF
jgi:hypothetical protein